MIEGIVSVRLFFTPFSFFLRFFCLPFLVCFFLPFSDKENVTVDNYFFDDTLSDTFRTNAASMLKDKRKLRYYYY